MSKLVSWGVTFLFVVVMALIPSSREKVFTRCQLATLLYRTYSIPKSKLADWVCLTEAESNSDTSAVGPPNTDGSRDYGLFQINSFYWCSGGKNSKHNGCKVRCSALTNSDISDDVKCAKLIFDRQGFMAWYGWQYKCKDKNLKNYLAECKL